MIVHSIAASVFWMAVGYLLATFVNKHYAGKTVVKQVSTKDNTTMIGIVKNHDKSD